jgi:hypothetical protein
MWLVVARTSIIVPLLPKELCIKDLTRLVSRTSIVITSDLQLSYSLLIDRPSCLCWSIESLSCPSSLSLSIVIIPLFVDRLNVFLVLVDRLIDRLASFCQSIVPSLLINWISFKWSIESLAILLSSNQLNLSLKDLSTDRSLSLYELIECVCCLYWSILVSLSIDTVYICCFLVDSYFVSRSFW